MNAEPLRAPQRHAADGSLEAQAKILRAVEYGQFQRVGSSESVQVDVRLVAATNADLRRLVRTGAFRADLLDRLTFEVLVVPALRLREGDVPLLARHFAGRMGFELGQDEPPVFVDEAMARLEAYPWPGNVRELRNVIERAVYLAEGDDVQPEHLVFDPLAGYCAGIPPREESDWLESLLELPLHDAVKLLELERIRRALEAARHNQRTAASDLYRKYKTELLEAPEH
jgi:psp operon transcriptional activator